MAQRERKLSDVLKRGYSDEELKHLYELGRFYLESGRLSRAAKIFNGITAVAPEFIPAWLGMVCVEFGLANKDQALHCAREAHKRDLNSPVATLFLITALFATGDLASAGALLGEVGDILEGNREYDTNLIRFYQAQMARFRSSAGGL